MPDQASAQWYEQAEGSAACGLAAIEFAQRLWSQNQVVRTRVRRHIERYHGASLNPVDWRATFCLQTDLPLVWNLTRSMVGTVVSNVGAANTPKVQFVTSDADWSTRRKAQKLDQFVDALALQPCPPYTSEHELRVSCLRDACLFSRGFAQVSADSDLARVTSERVLPWELMWDTRDARYNCPSELVRAYPMSRRALKAWFPKHEAAIDLAKEATTVDLELELGITPLPSRVSHDQRQVYELWILAQSPEMPGRHVVCCDGIEEPLLDEKYELTYSPFVGIFWDPPLVGGVNHSLADEVGPIEDSINRSLLRCEDSARRTAMNTLFYKSGSITVEDLEETADAACVEFTGDVPPTMVQAQVINESMVSWLQLQRSAANDLTGINESTQTGSREPGVPSASGQRLLAAQQTKRLAWLGKQVEAFQVQWARLVVNAVRAIADEKEDFSAKWPGAGYLREIKWKDVDLADDQFVLQIHPTSSLKNTPADRVQRAEEYFTKGVISLATYEAIVNGAKDVDAETKEQNVQRELIGRYIDQWLDATEEQLKSGWVNEANGLRLVPPPIKWMPSLPDAVLQVATAYLSAQLDGAPDANCQCFLDWLEMADAMLQAEAAKKAQLAAMQKPQTGGPAPGGAPPAQMPPAG